MTIDGYRSSIAKTLFSPGEISAAIDGLARRIAGDYAGKPLLVLGVLKGALYVTADLVRAISRLPGGPSIEMDFLVVSSYGNSTRSSGEVRLLKDTGANVAGKNVLVVEDIVDNGLTLQYLQSLLIGRSPATLRSCVLFDKPYNRRVDVPIDYVGLVAPDEFVVGYGLDYGESYRNLPYVAQLRPTVFSK
ncbi:MAG TPA: hypoxanthine phosphoribosyltransferase [Candidatus Baltobacteraceae bacterium]|jgi:hypoxanthine phosphoribosyltransferase|nr:hypoxanthine phosphoribosyltransferase [Candidatus Baltobacteraceae bacterium]